MNSRDTGSPESGSDEVRADAVERLRELQRHRYAALLAAAPGPLRRWLSEVGPQAERRLAADTHGDLARWASTLWDLPACRPSVVALGDAVRVGAPHDLTNDEPARLREALLALHPWRKGPLELFGLHIDSEWRSDLKWARLQARISSLSGRRVLDVGCGNGYYALRMLGAGAELVVGLDPMLLFFMQFQAIVGYLDKALGSVAPAHVLPLGVEALGDRSGLFDSVFSMGVLYHRRSPVDHLLQLRRVLRPGGELVLETLVVDGDVDRILVPEGRYAKMPNVWFIPSVAALLSLMRKIGFRAPELIDQSVTSGSEQRATDWMRFESLADFLDPDDPTRTREGHPAPQRAILLARAPASGTAALGAVVGNHPRR